MDGIKAWHILAGGAAIIAAFYLLHPSTTAVANPGTGTPLTTTVQTPGRYTVTLGGFKAYPPARPMVATGPAVEARAGLAHF